MIRETIQSNRIDPAFLFCGCFQIVIERKASNVVAQLVVIVPFVFRIVCQLVPRFYI